MQMWRVNLIWSGSNVAETVLSKLDPALIGGGGARLVSQKLKKRAAARAGRVLGLMAAGSSWLHPGSLSIHLYIFFIPIYDICCVTSSNG
mgnify:CR=1 FL=1